MMEHRVHVYLNPTVDVEYLKAPRNTADKIMREHLKQKLEYFLKLKSPKIERYAKRLLHKEILNKVAISRVCDYAQGGLDG